MEEPFLTPPHPLWRIDMLTSSPGLIPVLAPSQREILLTEQTVFCIYNDRGSKRIENHPK